MRRRNLFVLTVLAVIVLCLLTACSSTGGSGKKVEGIWLSDDGSSYSFAKDGTFYWLYGLLGSQYKKHGTYLIQNDQLILNYDKGNSEKYSFTCENDSLTLFREGFSFGANYKKTGSAEKTAIHFDTKITTLEGLYVSNGKYIRFYNDGTVDYAMSIDWHGKMIEQKCTYKNENGKLTIYSTDGTPMDSYQFELNDSSIILYDDSSTGIIYQHVNPDYQSESDMLDYVVLYMANKYDEFVEKEEENNQYAVRWLTSYDAGPQLTHYPSSDKAGWDVAAIDKDTFFIKYTYQAKEDYYKSYGSIIYIQHGFIPFECSFKGGDIQIATVLDNPQLKEKYIQLGLISDVENQQTSNGSSSDGGNNTAQTNSTSTNSASSQNTTTNTSSDTSSANNASSGEAVDPLTGYTASQLMEVIKGVVRENSGINESEYPEYEWNITKNGESNYGVLYYVTYSKRNQTVYAVSCAYNPSTADLYTEIILNHTEVNEDRYIQETYSGEAATVLEYVKKQCSWYPEWLQYRPVEWFSKNSGWDWEINQTGENEWSGKMYEFDWDTGAYMDLYEFVANTTNGSIQLTSESVSLLLETVLEEYRKQ